MPDLTQFRDYLRLEKNAADGTMLIYMREAEWWLEFLVDRDPSEELVREHIRARGGSVSTINRRLAVIKNMARCYRYTDPTALINRPKRKQGIPRPVENLDGVLGRLDTPARLAAIFISQTGCRISEAYSINEPVPVRPVLHIVQGKGGKDRRIPLTYKAQAALTALGGRMPYTLRTLQARFRKVGLKAHALRHHFACELAAAGADLGDVQELLGHASPATTRIYMAYRIDRLQKAVALLEGPKPEPETPALAVVR